MDDGTFLLEIGAVEVRMYLPTPAARYLGHGYASGSTPSMPQLVATLLVRLACEQSACSAIAISIKSVKNDQTLRRTWPSRSLH